MVTWARDLLYSIYSSNCKRNKKKTKRLLLACLVWRLGKMILNIGKN
jgi:hypothetical protein